MRLPIRALYASDPRYGEYDLLQRKLALALNSCVHPFDEPVDPLLARADVEKAWADLPELQVILDAIWEQA